MEDCQRVENVFGSLQSEFIFIRSILLWKQPVYSFFAFCVLSFIGSYCTPGFFRYNVYCFVLCVLLLCLSLWVLPKVKLSAAIQRGQTSAEEKKSHGDTNMAEPAASTANGTAESTSNSTNTVVRPLHLKNDTKGVSLDKSSPPQELKTESRTLANEIQAQKRVTASVPSPKKNLKPASTPATSHKSHGSKRPSAASRQIGIEKTAPHYLNVTTPLNTVPQRVVPGSDNTDAIPLPHTYICSHYLMGGCTEARYCTMHHLKKPYQWIYFYQRKWWMVNDDDNDQLETCFCTPDVTEEILDLNLSRVTFGIRTRYFLSFDAMTILGVIDLPIKRLSTKSQAELPGCSVATKWCWYWKNGYENFEEYKFQEGNASQELERQYLRGESSFEFQVAMNRYKIYFKKCPMYQTNLHYKTKREVRRRPCLSSTRHKSASSIIWNVMEKKKEEKKGAKNKEGYTRVELKTGDSEYRDIKCLFTRTFHSHKNLTVLTIESIERVENQSLWEKYSSTYMDSSGHDYANERFLFHGTREQSVKGICKTNFDWRMSGESVGAIYGEATYFATDAAKSHHYTLPDSNNYRYMFVALVLVGS